MKFETILRGIFSVTYQEADFVKRTHSALNKFGFTADNAIGCVDVCRDEISQSFFNHVRDAWGEAFNLSSLAGMFFAGRTALIAAMHHAPDADGKERYVFYAFPHIALGAEGQLGVCVRKGRGGESSACGALNAFQKEMAEKRVTLAMDNEDVEQSLLRMRLLQEIPYGHVPDLLELTKTAQKVIQRDLENTLKPIINTAQCDYAVITGIQIHGPEGNYIWPASCYAVIGGMRQEINLQ